MTTRCLSSLLVLLLALPCFGAEPERPRLAVLVFFDQLRGDYLTRWDDLFVEDGFRRLTKEGAWYQNCHYPYANTVTGPGHASVSSGLSPCDHGIIANDWYDRRARAVVNCVGSDRYERVPLFHEEPSDDPDEKKKARGVSPERLLKPNVADRLKAKDEKSKVVALSLKDRGAVLPGGHKPDACYWFETGGGMFVTSTYYRDRPHDWVAAYNASHPSDRWFGTSWTRLREDIDYTARSGPDAMPGESRGTKQGVEFPHPFGLPPRSLKSYHTALYCSPFGNDLLLELAGRAIDAEKLGQDDVPDLLCLSFSCNDPVGHAWGPDSQEVLDVTLRSDRIVRDLLRTLDQKVGKGRYTIVMSADHGVCPLPESRKADNKGQGRVSSTVLKTKANEHLVSKFGGDARTRYLEEGGHPWVYLNHASIRARKLDVNAVAAELAAWLPTQPGIQTAYTRQQILAGLPPDDAIGQAVRLSYHADRSGDVAYVLKPYHLLTTSTTGTSHGTPHAYDTHVPLVAMGPGVTPGVLTERVAPQKAAEFLKAALGIED